MKQKIRIGFALLLSFLLICALPLGLSAGSARELVAAGVPFGVKFHTQGVVVVGIPSGKGPAAEAGIQKGDVITALDGEAVASAEDFAERIKSAGERTLSVDFKRGALSYSTSVTPRTDESGEYKLGVWVKDSAAGIGTITFIDPKTMSFAGLGHGICDAESGEPLPFAFGSAEDVTLTGIVVGKAGAPGELRGTFGGHKIGKLLKNDLTGIYGVLAEMPAGLSEEKYPVCKSRDVKEGKAYILATVDGEGRKRYEIEIFDIALDSKDRNFSVKVTDEALLSKTGGIVQGMGVIDNRDNTKKPENKGFSTVTLKLPQTLVSDPHRHIRIDDPL